jgi:hypothetical protein
MSLEDSQKWDQASALLADTWPPHVRRMYLAYIEQGFTEAQSFELVRTQVFVVLGGRWETRP